MAVDPSVVINIAAEYTGKKAFSQADKATQQLSKSVKRLAGAFGIAFGARGAMQAVKAFAADDKAARTLSKTLDNLGLSFADPATKVFIADLERQYAVLDDQLRPAFQKLITTTGDFKKSQELLKTALDLSAMSGVSVVEVAGDLSKAYAGNTRGLLKYGLGITKAELATMSFDEILTRVAKVSSGQAQAAADTLSGSIAKLSVASANAAESLGKDLVQALTTLGGDGGLPKTLGLIESIANAIGIAIIGFSRFIRVLDVVTGSGAFKMVGDLNKLNAEFLAADRARAASKLGGTGMPSSYQAKKAADALAAKAAGAALAATKKSAKAAADAAAKKAIADKKAADLSKAAAVFDLSRISIAAALRATYDNDTRLRLLAMQAIEDEDGAKALGYLNQLKLLQDSVQAAKLAGITTISNASLAALNSQLLKELAAIDATKMSEDDKNKARDAAFAKYNDAITKQGGLALANEYNERVQIQLTSIAKLAALQGYGAALDTMNRIMVSNELAIAKTQSANDLARYSALKDYIALLGVAYDAARALAAANAAAAVIVPKVPNAPYVPKPVPRGVLPDYLDDPVIPPYVPKPVPKGVLPDYLDISTSIGNMASGNNSGAGSGGGNTIIVNTGATLGTEDTIVEAVQTALQTLNRRGGNTQYAGAIA